MQRISITFMMLVMFGTAYQAWGQSLDLRSQEARLAVLFDSLAAPGNEHLSDTLSHQINAQFRSVLSQPGSFNFMFDSLEYARKLMAKKKKLAIITYTLRAANAPYTFHGFIQLKPNKGQMQLIELDDRSDSLDNPVREPLQADAWYGAFYYKLLTHRYQNTTYYTLLGWDGHNLYTNRKVIEIMQISPGGNVSFGAPILQTSQGVNYRRIFKFSQQAVMTLRFDDRMDMIIYDHLAPQSSFYEGQYEYYGPDFTQDGLEFKKGVWRLHRNIEVTNPRN